MFLIQQVCFLINQKLICRVGSKPLIKSVCSQHKRQPWWLEKLLFIWSSRVGWWIVTTHIIVLQTCKNFGQGDTTISMC